MGDILIKTPVIFAAGGIVTFQSLESPLIAVIHRPQYDDWCLPKGKLKEGESFEDAALREVKEETRCTDLQFTGFAGTTYYKHNDIPKFVHYWHMSVKERPKFKEVTIKDEYGKEIIEVDNLLWLTPEEAVKKLTHKDEQNLLKTVCFCGSFMTAGIWSRLYRWVIIRQNCRLSGSLKAYRPELENRIALYQAGGGTDKSWITNGRELLDRSEIFLGKNRLDEGWKCFHAARRMEIYGLDENQLKIKAKLLLSESEKLSSWRKKATEDLLSDVKCDKTIDKEKVYQAALLLDEHFNNQAFKQRKLQDYLIIIGIILFVVVSAILWKVFGIFNHCSAFIHSTGTEILSVLLFGLFGGATSAAFSVEKNTLQAKIPELTTQTWINIFRIFVGGAAAIFVFTVIKAGIIDALLSNELTKMIKLDSEAAALVIAFAAGFSERLVLKGIEVVTKEKK